MPETTTRVQRVLRHPLLWPVLAFEVVHPYPVDLDSLFAAVAPYVTDPAARA